DYATRERLGYAAAALDSRLRSSSSCALNERGHSSDSHRSLTTPSSARPSPSTAHAVWLKIVKWQNLRPHLRHPNASLDPRAADQSSILTLKSCVSQCLLATTIRSSSLQRIGVSTRS